ncbi:MAG: succinyl-CoA--3-ketoacid-CoA transferase [Candidatus Cloacimonadota bacterium]|nr:MAG: succinyl-CoA--3-ketoacid-CoA transferase [Candidatus Cloacimonadota bacterium]
MAKILASSKEAMNFVKDGMTLMVGGFGVCGLPENLVHALADTKTKDITLISNNGSVDNWGNGKLIANKQIKKLYASYIGENAELAEQFISGKIDVELVPQGTLAERIRAGGAGIPAFFTPTGFGTKVAEGKESRNINGKDCILEEALLADVSFIKAHKADKMGNLVFNKTAQNFNPLMATAGKITIVEVEEIVENGQLAPDEIHLASIYVNYLVKGEQYDRRIEKRTYRNEAS